MNYHTITVRKVTLGDGSPKICVPITARDRVGLEEQLVKVRAVPCDLVELRADYYDGDSIEELAMLRAQMPDMPILFTFRTKEEGGEGAISLEEYAALNRRAAGISAAPAPAGSGTAAGDAAEGRACDGQPAGNGRIGGMADFIDLEYNRGENFLRELCRELQGTGVKVIASFHDFAQTPEPDTLVQLLCRMQELGADVTKAAVMPQNERDVLKLLQAAVEMKERRADRPYIVMSMGRLGAISRLAGTWTGSAVTFATAAASSAPGQMDADLVARVLSALA